MMVLDLKADWAVVCVWVSFSTVPHSLDLLIVHLSLLSEGFGLYFFWLLISHVFTYSFAFHLAFLGKAWLGSIQFSDFAVVAWPSRQRTRNALRRHWLCTTVPW
jgi:hypothetical protein